MLIKRIDNESHKMVSNRDPALFRNDSVRPENSNTHASIIHIMNEVKRGLSTLLTYPTIVLLSNTVFVMEEHSVRNTEESSAEREQSHDMSDYAINDSNDLFDVNPSCAVIRMKDSTCNESDITTFDVTMCSKLRELYIGNECLQSLKEWSIENYRILDTIVIGSNCMSLVKGIRFEIRNCDHLKSVTMGSGCCVNWSSFSLKDCPTLQTVSIGDGCFVNCESTMFES